MSADRTNTNSRMLMPFIHSVNNDDSMKEVALVTVDLPLIADALFSRLCKPYSQQNSDLG